MRLKCRPRVLKEGGAVIMVTPVSHPAVRRSSGDIEVAPRESERGRDIDGEFGVVDRYPCGSAMSKTVFYSFYYTLKCNACLSTHR